MRQVTIHTVDGETDRELERALLALDPAAQVIRVSGRLGRPGVRVCAHLALRYLANETWSYPLDAWPGESVPDAVEVTASYGAPETTASTATVVLEPPPPAVETTSGATAELVVPVVADKPVRPAKKAAAKAPKKTEEV